MTSNRQLHIRIFFLLLIVGISIAGCNREKKITGREFVSRDVLVNVITEIHLMDGITNDIKYYRKFNPGDSIDLYSSIFDKYGIDRKKYERTINEYSKSPQLLDKVYDEVLMKLKLLQDQVEMEEEDQRTEVIRGRELPEP